MLRTLNMVEIRVSDWDSAVQWYTEKLGLTMGNVDEHRYCRIKLPDGNTTIALNGTMPVELGSHNRTVPLIQVDDLDGTVAELRRRGVEFSGDIRSGKEGYRIVSLDDPEGNRLQLYELTGA